MKAVRSSRLRALLPLFLLGAAIAVSGCAGAGKFAGYDLPPEKGRYKLVVDHENTHTTWEFLSSRVTQDQRPEGNLCPEEMHAVWLDEIPPPCRPEPLIFLRYDANVGLDNAVVAGRPHLITLTVYRQAANAPRLAGHKLSVSTDDGKTWRPVTLLRKATPGEYLGVVWYPKLADTTGAVSLRAEAWDVDDNRVTQTVDRAWFLRQG